MDFQDPNDPTRKLSQNDSCSRALWAVALAAWMTGFSELLIRRGELSLGLAALVLLDAWCVGIATTSLRDLWSATAGTPACLARPGVEFRPTQRPEPSWR